MNAFNVRDISHSPDSERCKNAPNVRDLTSLRPYSRHFSSVFQTLLLTTSTSPTDGEHIFDRDVGINVPGSTGPDVPKPPEFATRGTLIISEEVGDREDGA
jgi:hypothetical protein